MDIASKLGQAIKELEDLKKALIETDQKLNSFSQQKQRILDTGLIVQGRIQALQELLADQELQKKNAETLAEGLPAPLEVK